MGRIAVRCLAAFALLAACAAPSAASGSDPAIGINAARDTAGSAPNQGRMKLVLAGSDAANLVELSTDPGSGDLLISSPAGVSAPPAPCTLDDPTEARCPAGSISAVRGGFLAGDDTLTVTPEVPVPVRVWGGNGDDQLSGGARGDVLRGDGGDDRLTGHGRADTLVGGPGTDVCSGGAGHRDTAVACEDVRSVP